MARRSDLPTHNEIEDNVEELDDQMDEKEDDLEILTEDVETVRDVREQLDLGTTADGTEQLETRVDAAEDETVDVYEGEDENLEQIQDETQGYADEIDDRHDSGRSDLEKLSDASSKLRTTETINEFTEAKVSTLEEMDFLKDINQRTQDAKEESEQIQQQFWDRIDSGRRS